MNLWESIYGVITGTVEERLKIHFPVMSVLSGMLQFSSVAQSCLTLCDPMDCSTSGLPVHHKLLEFTQIHVL